MKDFDEYGYRDEDYLEDYVRSKTIYCGVGKKKCNCFKECPIYDKYDELDNLVCILEMLSKRLGRFFDCLKPFDKDFDRIDKRIRYKLK